MPIYLKYRKLLSGLCFVALFCATLISDAQPSQPRFKNFSVENGLSISSIMDIQQTPDGMLWFATPDGLNKFNGYTFTSYKHIPNDTTSLPDNYITSILALKNGNLVVGCHSNELSIFNPYKQTFSSITHSVNAPIKFIREDQSGLVWVAFENGELLIFKDKVLIKSTETPASNPVFSCFLQANNTIYLGGSDALYSCNTTDFKITAVPGTEGLGVTCLENTNNNEIAIGSYDGVWMLENNKLVAQHLAGNIIMTLLSENNQTLWIGSYFEGLFRMDTRGNTPPEKFQNNSTNLFSLVNNVVQCSYKDKAGNLWFGTISGISAYFPLNQQMSILRHESNNNGSLTSNNIYEIFVDSRNRVWIGTLDAGFNLFDRKSGKCSSFTAENTNGLLSNVVRSIFEDSKGNFWISNQQQGLCRFYPDAKKATAIKLQDGTPQIATTIRDIMEDDKGNLWLATEKGLVIFNPSINEFQSVDIPGGSENMVVYDIEYETISKTWIAATFGEGIFLLKNGRWSNIRHINNNTLSLNNNNVMSLCLLNSDTLLMGTYGGGLNILNLKTGAIGSVSTREGLSNENIYGILLVKGGELWMSTNKGICVYNLYSKKVKTYDLLQQVQSLEFNESAFAVDHDGYFYFGGINGVNYFNPRRLKTNTYKPPILITGIRVMGRDFPFQEKMNSGSNITLKHGQNFIQIDFCALNYSNSEKNQYAYILEGFNDSWVMAGINRSATYTNLDPGTYTFKVKACNDDGVWCESPATLTIVIQPPFWRTWWFFTLTFLAVIGLFLLILFLRTRFIKRSYQLAMTDTELRALRSQMNPHFIFNSINSIQYFILNKEKKEAYNYLSKFSTLMRFILQNSRLNFIKMNEELEALKLYLELEKMRLEDDFEYQIDVSPDIDTQKIEIPSMIIQPYIENAILHGLIPQSGPRKLDVIMRKGEKHIFCVVEDNGIGRDAAKVMKEGRSQGHTSTAMQVTKGRLEILNNELGNKTSVNIVDLKKLDGTSAGTRVELFIPFK